MTQKFDSFEVKIETDEDVVLQGLTVKADEYGSLPYYIMSFAQRVANELEKTVSVRLVATKTTEFEPEKKEEAEGGE